MTQRNVVVTCLNTACPSMVYRTFVGELRTAETEASDSHLGLDQPTFAQKGGTARATS